jgi:hypothetical protein
MKKAHVHNSNEGQTPPTFEQEPKIGLVSRSAPADLCKQNTAAYSPFEKNSTHVCAATLQRETINYAASLRGNKIN